MTETVSSIPGNRPYKKAGGAGLVPKLTKDCVKCGMCAKKCPVQAIDPISFTADSKKCISCMRCIRQCPYNARKVKAIPHKDCGQDATSDFLSDETKNAVTTLCIHEAFCKI